MSGHSKWSTIKRKKGKIDQERGKLFSKVVREIMMAAKISGPDPDANARLRLALQKAKEVNMPADNIKRAIQKGASAQDNATLEEIVFEAYANNGVALLIKTLTDNRNRTVPNIRSILTKVGGSLATVGAVSYLFSKKGTFIFEPGVPEEKIMEVAEESGVEDINIDPDGSIEVTVDPNNFENIKNWFDKQKLVYASSSIGMIPATTIELNEEQARKLLNMIEKLEEDDDVQDVYGNYSIPDDIIDKLA